MSMKHLIHLKRFQKILYTS